MRKLETIKIHIVDDSASVRKVLGDLLDTDSSLEVIDTSSDPIIAEKKLKKRWPDVFILDIEMPHKDGITFLKEIMATRPFSSLHSTKSTFFCIFPQFNFHVLVVQVKKTVSFD